jgi:hypothetical protein
MANHVPNGNAIPDAMTKATPLTCNDLSVISTRSRSKLISNQNAACIPCQMSFKLPRLFQKS